MDLWFKVHVPSIEVWIMPVEFDFGVGGLCFDYPFDSTSCVVWARFGHRGEPLLGMAFGDGMAIC